MDSPQVKSNNIYYFNQGHTDHRLIVLLVNGDAERLAQWQALFSSRYDVEIAPDGASASRILASNHIDFVISAVQLPIISGINLCQLMKHNSNKSIPIMLVTNTTNEKEEERALLSGAIDYLSVDSSPTVFVNRVKNHMALIQVNKKLEIDAKTDALTGLANRASLDQQLEEALNNAKRGNYAVSLMMLDIDYFKDFNDKFGHVAGDECLKKVAHIIQSFQQRKNDLAARYGGEEFILLLPYTDELGSQKLACEMLAAIRHLNIAQANKSTSSYVSVSIGIATFNAKDIEQKKITATKFIEHADRNLYKAKNSGRNKYCY